MTEPLGAGNSREYDILGIKMFDSAELRVHMTGKAILRTGAKTQGQGHETTWAQIVAHELGIPAEDVVVEEGDTDTAPFGMGTYASRSTPVAGAAVAMVARKVRAKARKLAAHLLEVSEDVEWELGRFYVRGAPERGATIQECAMAAYSNMPDGMEPGLENNAYHDPPNPTWPFACYVATVEVDPETGVIGGVDAIAESTRTVPVVIPSVNANLAPVRAWTETVQEAGMPVVPGDAAWGWTVGLVIGLVVVVAVVALVTPILVLAFKIGKQAPRIDEALRRSQTHTAALSGLNKTIDHAVTIIGRLRRGRARLGG